MLVSLTLLLSLVPQVSADAQNHALRGIELGPSGVFTHAPRAGLYSVDGPEVALKGEWAEWFGISFRDGTGAHEGVGAGLRPDWAQRTPVERLGTSSGGARMSARVRLGSLEIETLAEIEGELVIVTVTLENTGSVPVRELFYSREWWVAGATGWTFPMDLPAREGAPAALARRLWMLDDLEPGTSSGLIFSFRHGPRRAPLGTVDVPLSLYVNAIWPNGVALGRTNGISFGDYDADGWIDIFSLRSGRLMRNEEGASWILGADLDDILPLSTNPYGSSFGDYDNDGLPDIGTEPRAGFGDSCMHMLHNLGDAQFEDIATDPLLFEGQPCNAPAETICWGDVDEDGDLDVFLPVYPRQLGPGNFFMENLGPTGPLGAYRFRETSAEAGLNNPPMTARPEGAQFLDVDRDGDMDLYSNGTLYENRSEDRPTFVAGTQSGNGIGLRNSLEEGAAFFDYDLDGDQDLHVVYTNAGVRIWESRGDGTFFQQTQLIDGFRTGLDLGLSAEDWDMDGDMDLTTRQVFRRNQFLEQGKRHYTVASHSIPANHLTSATPAWGDWDKDGDLDCALGNWQSTGHFYENTLWDETTPASHKPYLRVRVVRDDPAVPRGLETEYGATVEVVLHGDAFRRQKFVASGHGYLNQNEYVLTFALPPGPNAGIPVEGLVCDVVVDFPSRASRGVLRIDRYVNEALGNISIADLDEREITVFRSGRVVLDGVQHEPGPSAASPRLAATGGGLALPDTELGLPEPLPVPGANHWAGIEIRTGPVLDVMVKELVFDGQLAATTREVPFNLALWDVTESASPVLVHQDARSTSSRNRRTHFPLVLALEPERVYRCVAHVTELRPTPPRHTAFARSGLQLMGGLELQDSDPTTGKEVALAPLRSDATLSLRYVAQKGLRRR